jgi:hypothetical protein
MTSPFLLLAMLAPQGPLPIMEYKASYPYGEQLCNEVDHENKRAFVALGAAIAVLDVETLGPPTTPPVIDYIEVPDVTPLSLLYFDHTFSGGVFKRWLFIAGGSLGLASVELGDELFQSPPAPCTTCVTRYIDKVGSPSVFQYKRCVDVAVVEDSALTGGPLLCALYGASNDTSKSSIGASVLRTYDLLPDGSAAFVSEISLGGLGGVGHPDPVATAMVSDPLDPLNVYVAMGTAWLFRVNLVTGSVSQVDHAASRRKQSSSMAIRRRRLSIGSQALRPPRRVNHANKDCRPRLLASSLPHYLFGNGRTGDCAMPSVEHRVHGRPDESGDCDRGRRQWSSGWSLHWR